MSAETAVQAALYTALTGLGLTVYDVAPQASDGGSTASWPYVEIGFIGLSEWDTGSWLGHEFTARIHTRGQRAAGMAAVKTIQGDIYEALHRVPLTITGQQNVVLARQTSFCDRAPDGTFHGVCEYNGLIKAT